MYNSFVARILALVGALALPSIASAHEVYVLDAASIARDVAAVSPNPFDAYATNEYQFFFWGFVSFVTVSTIFCMTAFHFFEKRANPFLFRLKKYAQPVARVTFGLCLIACAYFGGLFGPELPLEAFAGTYTWLIKLVLYAAGALITAGLFTRAAALSALLVFALALLHWGSYMLTYSNYFGEIIFALILGGGYLSIEKMDRGHAHPWLGHFAHRMEQYAFPALRILFGVSVAYAAIYAKFLHSNLALDTVNMYHLTDYFHFQPLFVVLGACIIEVLMGVFFIIGLQIRWVAVFFLFWIFLSLLYFGESVWPHLILVGLNITFFFHGYDRYSIEGYLFKRRLVEPVL